MNASIESPSGLLPELTFTTSVSFSGAVSWIVLMRLSRLLMLFCVLHRLKGRVYAIFNIIDACCLVGLILICCFLCLTDFFFFLFFFVKCRFVVVGRSFFSPSLGKPGSLGSGTEYWRGYYQSLRPTQMGLSLNISWFYFSYC